MAIKFPDIVANICGTVLTLEDHTYLILSHRDIIISFSVTALGVGFPLPNVAIWLSEGLNSMSHSEPRRNNLVIGTNVSQ